LSTQGAIKADIRKQLTDYADKLGIDIRILGETHMMDNKNGKKKQLHTFHKRTNANV